MNGTVKEVIRNKDKFCSVPGCRAYHINNSDKCATHSGKFKINGRLVDIAISNDLVSLKKYLCQLAMDIRRGKVKPQVGNAVKNAVDSVIQIEDKMQVVAKLEEMTKALEQYQDMGIENAELASLELENEFQDSDE